MPFRQQYGLQWKASIPPLEIELLFIRSGGYLPFEGLRYGRGLFHHHKAAQTLIWPSEDHHRWSDLVLKTMCEERITVVQGPRDAGKTRTASKWALVDYWASPDNTLTIMTSTGIRELELRVWGDIKTLYERGKEAFPWLPGNMNQANHGIFTDALDDRGDVRDFRRSLICVPLIGGDGEWRGLDRFVGMKQDRRRLIGDECFPAGTMVDTVLGPRPIETVGPGTYVLSAIGFRPVVATSSKLADELYRMTLSDGRSFRCTWNHLLLTNDGWKRACEIHQGQFILGAYETMQELRKANGERSRLLACLLAEMDDYPSGSANNLHDRTQTQSQCEGAASDADCQSNEDQGVSRESQSCVEAERASSESARRERNRSDQGGMATDADVSGRNLEFRNQDREVERERVPADLQSGSWISALQIGHRGGWWESRNDNPEGQRREKRQVPSGAWVDRVEILQPGDSGFPLSGLHIGRCRVYNLQVQGHPSYSVEGLIVHNCQFVPVTYVNTLDAFDKQDFKGAFLGNAIGGNGKALDKLAEPVGGWSTLGEVTKTKTWRNKYDGITINLVGSDSPNFDKNRPKSYPYLIDRTDIDKIVKRNGIDSPQYWTLALGIRKTGADAYKILPFELCERAGAFNTVIWSGAPRTRIYAVDAGFGGDPCETMFVEFGENVDGDQIICFHESGQVQIQVSSPLSPEDQIALAVKKEAGALGVPDENIFFDAGMRATLAVSFSRTISPQVNAVNFGGPATDRPVDEDTFIIDPKTKQRRLVKCSEQYSKFVTEMCYSVRGAVETEQVRGLPKSAAEEFANREWHWVPGPLGERYELETKPEYKTRNNGNSPNKSDVTMIGLEGARRLGFQIRKAKSKSADGEESLDWLEVAKEKHRRFQQKHELKLS